MSVQWLRFKTKNDVKSTTVVRSCKYVSRHIRHVTHCYVVTFTLSSHVKTKRVSYFHATSLHVRPNYQPTYFEVLKGSSLE